MDELVSAATALELDVRIQSADELTARIKSLTDIEKLDLVLSPPSEE
jgi:hypothetical protein